MSRGMNWDRARMDSLISARGSERFHEPADAPPSDRTLNGKPKSKKRSKRKVSGRTPQRKLADGPQVAQRRKLRQDFQRLSIDERARHAGEYRARLRALSSSHAAFDSMWRMNFQPLLVGTRSSRAPQSPARSGRSKATLTARPNRKSRPNSRSSALANSRRPRSVPRPARPAARAAHTPLPARTGLPG